MLKNANAQFDDYNKVVANIQKPKISKPLMTKYEFNQIISLRTNQIALGSPIFLDQDKIKIKSNMELRLIAIEELKEGKLPYIIKRQLPNNKYECYRIKDMDLTAVQYMMER